MNQVEQKKAAKQFVERWKAAEGNEQRESNSFWIELIEILGIKSPTKVLDFERKARGRRIDVFYEDMSVLIENKSRGINLDAEEQRGKDKYGNPRMVTPYEQAKWYADNITPRSIAPKWVITCNFDEIRIYDLDADDPESSYETLLLDNLHEHLDRLSFLVKKENSRAQREQNLSVAAGEVVGRLYDALSKRYNDIDHDQREQKSLNILIVRLVFLLYAEDADLLQENNAFHSYLKGFSAEHTRQAIIDLFRVLDTPKDQRDPYLSDELKAFPYINGGLFRGDIVIPQFDSDARFTLLQEASANFDWAHISPTIFGSVFESTLNPETRRAGGMHYTSVENIHKLTGPLFYDELLDELIDIEGLQVKRERDFKLKAFRKKIASLKFLDPACGSGNFLTETYLSLRKLENRVLEDLYGGQVVMDFGDAIQVSINQFYGIEINDFAVSVAKTALWIAELQMLGQTQEVLDTWLDPLPLKSNDNIHEGNALRMNWNDMLPASECNYVIGNPPFRGNARLDADQQEDRNSLFGKDGGLLDYVSCWYKKAAEYSHGTHMQCAFVSTNSICQGQQVGPLWKPLFDKGVRIDFAYRTFVWNSEATDQAHVHVIIIGFSWDNTKTKRLFYPDGSSRIVSNINAYLSDAPNVFASKRRGPISNVPPVVYGIKPADNGWLILSDDERDEILKKEPQAEKWIRPFITAREFVSGKTRWCLWMPGITQEQLDKMPVVAERVRRCREWRYSQTKTGDAYKLRDTPWLMRPSKKFQEEPFIVLPLHTSHLREYVPFGFVDKTNIPGNSVSIVPNATVYQFGVLSSAFHNAWIHTVCGRIKSDYRYASDIVYNTFVWPNPSQNIHEQVESCAQSVLDVRSAHPGKSLADLYDPDLMPDDLRQAHHNLDMAVEATYGVNFNGDEEKIVAHLFKLYALATEGEHK